MRFLGLGLEDRVPDAKTVWLYREQLTQAGVNHVRRYYASFRYQLVQIAENDREQNVAKSAA